MMRSILKKFFMALTGLGLLGFLVTHLAGNLLIFKGSGAFNLYADNLEHLGLLLIVAELGLSAIFVAHIVLAIKVTLENKAARPIAYQVKNTAGQSTFASRTMMITGVLILIFVVFHIIHFKLGAKKDHGVTVLWELVVNTFSNPVYALGYVVFMLILGTHLSHGASSILQTLGILKPHWRANSRVVGALIGWGIALGFASLPLYALLVKPAPDARPAAQFMIMEDKK